MQALEFSRTGKLPEAFTVAAMIEQEEPKTPNESQSNGAHTQIEFVAPTMYHFFESAVLKFMLTVYVQSFLLIKKT